MAAELTMKVEERSLDEIDRLEEDPTAEGDYYPGDLLVAVLRVPRDYWVGDPEQHVRVNAVVEGLAAGELDDTLRSDITAFRA